MYDGVSCLMSRLCVPLRKRRHFVTVGHVFCSLLLETMKSRPLTLPWTHRESPESLQHRRGRPVRSVRCISGWIFPLISFSSSYSTLTADWHWLWRAGAMKLWFPKAVATRVRLPQTCVRTRSADVWPLRRFFFFASGKTDSVQLR